MKGKHHSDAFASKIREHEKSKKKKDKGEQEQPLTSICQPLSWVLEGKCFHLFMLLNKRNSFKVLSKQHLNSRILPLS
jgi:hypothetical protein